MKKAIVMTLTAVVFFVLVCVGVRKETMIVRGRAISCQWVVHDTTFRKMDDTLLSFTGLTSRGLVPSEWLNAKGFWLAWLRTSKADESEGFLVAIPYCDLATELRPVKEFPDGSALYELTVEREVGSTGDIRPLLYANLPCHWVILGK